MRRRVGREAASHLGFAKLRGPTRNLQTHPHQGGSGYDPSLSRAGQPVNTPLYPPVDYQTNDQWNVGDIWSGEPKIVLWLDEQTALRREIGFDTGSE